MLESNGNDQGTNATCSRTKIISANILAKRPCLSGLEVRDQGLRSIKGMLRLRLSGFSGSGFSVN